MSVLYRYHSECKTYWSNTCVCCHFPKGKRDCKASYVLQTRCCLGGLDSMSSFAVLYSPPGLWRLVFNLTVFVFITFTLSYASYPEKQSENLPRLLRSPLWSTDYRLKASPCHHSCSFCLPSHLWFFDILTWQPVISVLLYTRLKTLCHDLYQSLSLFVLFYLVG